MKNIHCQLFLAISLILTSCGSDKLSNRKAENIIEDCLEKEPEKRTVTIRTDRVSLVAEALENYKSLADEGFIDLEPLHNNAKKPKKLSNDPLDKWRYESKLKEYNSLYKNAYTVKLTNKAQKYIDEALENSKTVTMKTHAYEVDEVLEVQEIPSMNVASVKVRFKPTDITPFSILLRKDIDEFLVKDINMARTSNGWKYCDNF